ncbi:uncharacterized protein LOC120211031 [Hibiscus syriacus]|uniref:uncharacterized protein LOC120211031 n=1 Tax=Hibiscus syriacus TaxID=106335 RepID=UPI0019250185|nr:uncharacterized protein LOC120211031 [Hibiscus syriacus]
MPRKEKGKINWRRSLVGTYVFSRPSQHIQVWWLCFLGRDRMAIPDLEEALKGLSINIITMENDENVDISGIRPLPPGFVLNNWTAERLSVVFKSLSESLDIHDVDNDDFDPEVDFEQFKFLRKLMNVTTKKNTLMDNTTRNALFSFMDGFSRYNQIKMHPDDMEKTTLVTIWGTFYYKVMSFGLKDDGVTYQRAMMTLFHDRMHKEIEVYVDDMIVKAQNEDEHVENLRKLF